MKQVRCRICELGQSHVDVCRGRHLSGSSFNNNNEFRDRVSNCIHEIGWNKVTHPFHNINGDLVKPPSKIWHGWWSMHWYDYNLVSKCYHTPELNIGVGEVADRVITDSHMIIHTLYSLVWGVRDGYQMAILIFSNGFWCMFFLRDIILRIETKWRRGIATWILLPPGDRHHFSDTHPSLHTANATRWWISPCMEIACVCIGSNQNMKGIDHSFLCSRTGALMQRAQCILQNNESQEAT